MKDDLEEATHEELVELFLPHSIWDKTDFFIYRHSHVLWRILHWCWFCIYCGKRHFRADSSKCQKGEGNG